MTPLLVLLIILIFTFLFDSFYAYKRKNAEVFGARITCAIATLALFIWILVDH